MLGAFEKSNKIYSPEYSHIRFLHTYINNVAGAHVMVFVVGNGFGDTSSNPGRSWLHLTEH